MQYITELNPDAFEYDSENGRVMIAPWAAADIVGAAWGGATGAIGSYAGTGEVNWTAVGVGALSGAIAGSTGAVGKIAKWLFLNNGGMPVKSLIIVLSLLIIVWLPVFFNLYDVSMAVILTISFAVAGYIGDLISSRLKKRKRGKAHNNR